MEYFHSASIANISSEETSDFVVPSRRFASKPKIRSFRTTHLEHSGLLGHSVRVRQFIYNLFKFSTYWPTRARSHVRAYVVAFIILGSITALVVPVLDQGYEHVYAEANAAIGSDVVLSVASVSALNDRSTDLLQQYHPAVTDEATVAARTHLVSRYLYEKQSPLAPFAETIAAQPHWRMILAISFAESNFGKRCLGFNCSGIGGSKVVEYTGYADWIMAFNRLLAKRYTNKTIPEMCGVYVQPCNPNWMLATTQVLGELDELQIP